MGENGCVCFLLVQDAPENFNSQDDPKKKRANQKDRVGVWQKIGVPQNGWFIMENSIKLGWFGGIYPYFWKHPCVACFYGLFWKVRSATVVGCFHHPRLLGFYPWPQDFARKLRDTAEELCQDIIDLTPVLVTCQVKCAKKTSHQHG